MNKRNSYEYQCTKCYLIDLANKKIILRKGIYLQTVHMPRS